MNTNEELRQQMWELAYGLLSPEEVASLHARIKSDPVAARLYAEVRLQADLVADAAKVNDPSFAVSAQGEPVVRPMPARRSATSSRSAPYSPSRGMNWLAGVAGTALAALLCIVLFRPTASSDPSAEKFVATAVEAPARLQAGITQQVSLFTCAPDETGTAADVEVRLVDARGKDRLKRMVRTDENGHAKVELPGDAIEPGVRLEAIAKAELPAAESTAVTDEPVSLAAEVIPEPVERYVLLDKPAYERGETVHYALRDVKRFSKEPVVTRAETLGRRDDAIRPNAGPATSQTAQANESLITGSLQLEGVPLADAETQKNETQSNNGQFDQRLQASDWFFFNQFGDDIPVLAKEQASSDKLALDDRFDRRSGNRDLARSRGLRMSAAEAAPAEAGAAADAAKPGRAPLAAVRGGQASEFAKGALMGEVAAKQALDFDVIPSGQPIEVPLPSDRSADLLVTAKCGDRVVAKELVTWEKNESQDSKLSKNAEFDSAAKLAERATVRLTPVPEADGEILVSVFDHSQQPPQLVASHRYYREPAQRLEVELKNLRDRYEPGQQVELLIQVLDEQSRPVDATLAVRVWNERLVQAAGAPVADLASTVLSTPPTAEADSNSMAFQSYRFGGLGLSSRTEAGDKSGTGLADGSKLRGSKFADTDFLATELDALNDNEDFLGDVAPQRLEASNLAAVRAAYETAVSEAREAAAERKATIARLLMIGGLAVLGLLGMQALLRMSPKASVWLPAVAVAAASLLVGMVWWAPSFDRGEVVQTAAVPEEEPDRKTATSPPAGGEAIESLDQTEENEGGFGNAGRSLDKELRQPITPQMPDSASVETEDLETRENELRLKEKIENGAPPYRAADDVTSTNRTMRSRTTPAPTPVPAEEPADAPADNAPAVLEEGIARKGRGPTNGPQGLGRMELAESSMTDDAPRADAQHQSKFVERSKTDLVAGKRLAGTESASETAPKSALPKSGDRALDAPAAAAGAAGAAPPAPSADSIAASGGRGAAPPPAPAAARMARSQANPTEPGATDRRSADESSPSAAGLAGGKEATKDADSDRQLAKKNAGAGQLWSDQDLIKREQKAQAASTAPAALLFEPSLVTDAKGQATIQFTLPEVDCEYRVLIDAIGHGRVGSLQQVIVGQAEAGATAEGSAR